MGSRCTLLRPGLLDYDEALDLQRRIAADVRAGSDETLILLEHPPTYTLGVRGHESNLLATPQVLAEIGARVLRTDRGGDVTFHGPGQIVGYPIINLRTRGKGPVWHVRSIEQVLIDALSAIGIDAARIARRPGVWVDGAKIGAVGVRVSGGVTTHGFALNVNVDLSYFEHIVPCGIADAGVTSMQAIVGCVFEMGKVEDAIVAAFARLFDVEVSGSGERETGTASRVPAVRTLTAEEVGVGR